MAHPPQREWVYLGPSDVPFYKHPCPVHGPDALRYASSDQCKDCHTETMKKRMKAKREEDAKLLYGAMSLAVKPATVAAMVQSGAAEWDGNGGAAMVETDITDVRVVRSRRPCKHCGSTLRYRASRHCVQCQRAKSAENNEHYRQRRKNGV